MKRIKTSLIKVHQIVLTGILGILGFAPSCKHVEEYGAPYAEYEVRGKVTSSESGEPIKGIRVSMDGWQSAYTDAEGDYLIQQSMVDAGSKYFFFRDVDSIENGYYQDLDTLLQINNDEYSGGEGWDEGSVSKTLNVKLTPKK